MPDQPPPRHLHLVHSAPMVVTPEPPTGKATAFDKHIDALPPYPHLVDLQRQPLSGRAAIASALAVLEWADAHLPPSAADKLRRRPRASRG